MHVYIAEPSTPTQVYTCMGYHSQCSLSLSYPTVANQQLLSSNQTYVHRCDDSVLAEESCPCNRDNYIGGVALLLRVQLCLHGSPEEHPALQARGRAKEVDNNVACYENSQPLYTCRYG